ncbi:hypothetical protein HDU77_008950 [Chytriomyces hyalinus]|nr:hypothetical protein HDU77_008950 [Chytriomyces hyalinus]
MPTLTQQQQQQQQQQPTHTQHTQHMQQHRIILPFPEPIMYPLAFTPCCWSPESTVSPAHSPKLMNLPLPPILLSSHHREASPIPSLSSLTSWHSSDRCCPSSPPPCSSSSKIQKRLEQRKNAEKQRRDILRTCIHQVKQLLPRKTGISRVVSKERAVEQAYEYIVTLQQEGERKAHILKQLEAEIVVMQTGAVKAPR